MPMKCIAQINNLAVQQKDRGNKQKLALTKLSCKVYAGRKNSCHSKLLNKQVQQRIDNELKPKGTSLQTILPIA